MVVVKGACSLSNSLQALALLGQESGWLGSLQQGERSDSLQEGGQSGSLQKAEESGISGPMQDNI